MHRDVKPANVLLSGGDGADHAYITDFGVARNVATESGLTQTGRFVGTLDYVAPEQISGGAVDARVDVYALGCLLFKLLTGEVPFPKDGEAARLYAHLNDPPPAPSLYVPEVSMALDDVVIRAMSKSPDDRYPSAGDLGRAAQAALRGETPGGAGAHRRHRGRGHADRRDDLHEERGDPGRAPATEPTRRLADDSSTLIPICLGAQPPPLGSAGRRRRACRRAGRRDRLGQRGWGIEPRQLRADGRQRDDPDDGEDHADAEARAKDPDQIRADQRADAICEDSQNVYKSVRSQAMEESPDVGYAATLVGISERALRRLRALDPPPNLADEFKSYVEAQRLVAINDRQALAAAEGNDTENYVAARERRDSEADERYRAARAGRPSNMQRQSRLAVKGRSTTRQGDGRVARATAAASSAARRRRPFRGSGRR